MIVMPKNRCENLGELVAIVQTVVGRLKVNQELVIKKGDGYYEVRIEES
jgi:hypothetical protein